MGQGNPWQGSPCSFLTENGWFRALSSEVERSHWFGSECRAASTSGFWQPRLGRHDGSHREGLYFLPWKHYWNHCTVCLKGVVFVWRCFMQSPGLLRTGIQTSRQGESCTRSQYHALTSWKKDGHIQNVLESKTFCRDCRTFRLISTCFLEAKFSNGTTQLWLNDFKGLEEISEGGQCPRKFETRERSWKEWSESSQCYKVPGSRQTPAIFLYDALLVRSNNETQSWASNVVRPRLCIYMLSFRLETYIQTYIHVDFSPTHPRPCML